MTVVIEIDESEPESRESTSRGRESGSGGAVDETSALVQMKRVGLPAEIADQDVLIAVVVHILDHDPHARLGDAAEVPIATGPDRELLELQVTSVHPEVVGHSVVGDEEVEAAVTVGVDRRDSESGTRFGADAAGG